MKRGKLSVHSSDITIYILSIDNNQLIAINFINDDMRMDASST